MASTILLSDNGASSGSAGLKQTAGNDGVLILQSTTSGGTATAGITINNVQGILVPNTIGVGGATPSTSGAGITFPASQSASSDANTLDDYEEGTWTPSDSSGAGLSFTVTSAQYVKVGQMVTATAVFQYPVTANGSQCSLAGLPFATNMNNTTGSVLSATAGAQKVIQNSGTNFLLFAVSSTTPSTNAVLSGASIYLTLHYRCNS